jgi:hypothetical protein
MTLDLTPAERAWLANRRAEAERQAAEVAQQRPKKMPARMASACRTWREEAWWVATGLHNLEAGVPVSNRGEVSGARQSGPADPTASALQAAIREADSVAAAFAHLAGPCSANMTRLHVHCGCDKVAAKGCPGELHECPGGNAVSVAGWLDVELSWHAVVDNVMGTSPTSPASWRTAVSDLALWHAVTSEKLLNAWRAAWRDGAENSVLDTAVTLTEYQARRMTGLAGQLAGASGREEPRCTAGCGGKGPGVCGRCRTATWRANQRKNA